MSKPVLTRALSGTGRGTTVQWMWSVNGALASWTISTSFRSGSWSPQVASWQSHSPVTLASRHTRDKHRAAICSTMLIQLHARQIRIMQHAADVHGMLQQSWLASLGLWLQVLTHHTASGYECCPTTPVDWESGIQLQSGARAAFSPELVCGARTPPRLAPLSESCTSLTGPYSGCKQGDRHGLISLHCSSPVRYRHSYSRQLQASKASSSASSYRLSTTHKVSKSIKQAVRSRYFARCKATRTNVHPACLRAQTL